MKLEKIIVAGLLIASSLFAGSHGTHWGYTGHEGPANWGDLDSKYTMCKEGVNQSPIDILQEVEVKSIGMQNIDFNYVIGAKSIVNNGHTIQVNIKDGSSIKVDGIVFELKQFHFHTPSENQIEGKNFPLEAHFVHTSKDGKLAVVALMFEDGQENIIISKIWKDMPKKAGKEEKFNLISKHINNLLPTTKSYYRFNGSLTTPPCSEGVRWMVLKHYVKISKKQVKEFLDIFGHPNNRPIQAINARKVMK